MLVACLLWVGAYRGFTLVVRLYVFFSAAYRYEFSLNSTVED